MKIGIQILLPTATYLNKRYSIEMDFDDNSNPADAFKYLDDIVTAMHRKEYPAFYTSDMPNYVGEDQLPEIQKNVTDRESMIIQIKDEIAGCTNVIELSNYSIYLKTYPEIKELFDNIFNELKTK